MTIDEACQFLQISRPTFFRLRKEKKLKAVRVGGGLRLDPAEIRAFVKRNVSESTDD